MNHVLYTTTSLLVAIFMATMVIVLRLRSAKKPVSVKRIIIPPAMMSSGFLMFLFPQFVTPFSYSIAAFFAGTLFSIPLIVTSKFEEAGNEVYLKRSNAFIFILFVLLAIRLMIKIWVGDSLTALQSAGLFFVLAFGMIMPWRVAMLVMYQQLQRNRLGTD